MTSVNRFTDPNQLIDLATRLGSLSLQQKDSRLSESESKRITLVLLYPLAEDDMLAQCRSSNPHLVQDPSLPPWEGQTRNISEFISIRPLSKAWRRAFSQITVPDHIIFDIGLPPRQVGSYGMNSISWDTSHMGQFRLASQDVMNMVITLATAAMMRSDFSIRFDLTYPESENLSAGGMARLQRQLGALSDYKAEQVNPQTKTPVREKPNEKPKEQQRVENFKAAKYQNDSHLLSQQADMAFFGNGDRFRTDHTVPDHITSLIVDLLESDPQLENGIPDYLLPYKIDATRANDKKPDDEPKGDVEIKQKC